MLSVGVQRAGVSLARSGVAACAARVALPAIRQMARGYATPKLQEVDFSKLEIQHCVPSVKKTKTPAKDLVFGRTFSDHMLELDWTSEDGWSHPHIHPFGNLSLSPSCTVFHYALECFEGMKAYKDKNGNVRLFRPDMNMRRLERSCERIALPSFNGDQLLECIKELVRTDKDWIPDQHGFSLYVRPTAIATQPTLGVGPSAAAKMFVICSPVGPYYKTGFAPVSLLADPKFVRAWPGGVGQYKVGGNYAPGINPQTEAANRGYNQNLWLFGNEHFVTEVGTMNFFVLWKNERGEKELITAPLDGTILPGVTRDSILQLCREWNEFTVSERPFTMKELVKAIKDDRVVEVFGAGTACIVSPVKNIGYEGTDYAIPLALGNAGELTQRLADTIMSIQYGEVEHPWSVVIDRAEPNAQKMAHAA